MQLRATATRRISSGRRDCELLGNPRFSNALRPRRITTFPHGKLPFPDLFPFESQRQKYILYFIGAPGFEPGVTCTQNKHVSRYTTPRLYNVQSYRTKSCTTASMLVVHSIHIPNFYTTTHYLQTHIIH